MILRGANVNSVTIAKLRMAFSRGGHGEIDPLTIFQMECNQRKWETSNFQITAHPVLECESDPCADDSPNGKRNEEDNQSFPLL